MMKIFQILSGISALLVILLGFLTLEVKTSEAKKSVTTATTTYNYEAVVVDLFPNGIMPKGGVCYKLADNDGDGFTFLIANNGTITGSLTCD